MIKPKKNPVTKLIGAGVKAAAKVSASAAQKKIYKEKVTAPAKKVVKAAKKELKIEAKALKAAQGKSLASPVKKAAAKKNAKERVMVKRIAEANKGLNMKEPYATKDAMRLADEIAKMKAKNKALAFSAKGKTQTPTAEAARRRNLNK